MTDSELLHSELRHLINLMAEPYREGWKSYAWAKANALAASDPVYRELPRLLREAMQTDSKPSIPDRPSTDQS